ncbi:MAG: sensor histidine kinase [Bryobacteraceae bacterium]
MLPKSWPRALPWCRAALAVAAIALSYLYLPTASVLYEALLCGFLVYSILLALRAKPNSGLWGLLALFADVVYFMVIAVRGDSLIWFASLLFLFLLVEAAASFSVIEVALVAAVSAIFCAVLPFGNRHELERTIVISGAFAWGCAVNKRRQAAEIESLRESLEGAQAIAGKAREEEAKRIAADFHDGPLQSFISLQMRLEILRKLLDRDFNAGMEDLRQLQTLAQDQIRDLRAFLHSMRPVDVDGGNMIANARRTAESFQKETGIPVTFIGANSPVGLPQEMTLEVLQMIREALHNVQKHAGATRVAVAMEKTERGLEISIDDNGHGFPFAGSYSLEELELLRLGPASLKRRARSLNADLLLESRPGRGAGLKFRVPLQ